MFRLPPSAAARALPLVLLLSACGEKPDPVIPVIPDPVVASVRLDVDSATLVVADSIAPSAVVTDSRGATTTAFPITWTTSDAAVLRHVGEGRFEAVAVGRAQIVATAQGVSDRVVVEVVKVDVAESLVVADSAWSVLSSAAEIAGGQLRMEGSGPTPGVGDVVYGTTSGGFLRKVTSVERSGSTVIATTVPAKVTEVVHQGRLSMAEDLDIPAALAAARATPDAFFLAPPAGVWIDENGRVRFDSFNLLFEPSVTVEGVTLAFVLDGTVDVLSGSAAKPGTQSFTLDAEFEYCFPIGCLESLDFGVVLGVESELELSAEVRGNIAHLLNFPRLSRELIHIPIKEKCLLPPEALCVGVSLVLEAYAEVQAEAKATVSRTYNVEAGFDAGFTWKASNNRFTPRRDSWSSATQSDPVYLVEGSVGVRVGVEPKLVVSVFDAGELSAGLDGAVEAKVSANSNYEWAASVEALIDFFVRAEADILGLNVVYEPARVRLWDTDLPGAGGPLAKLALTPATLDMTVGDKATLTPRATSIVGGIELPMDASRIDWSVSPANVASVNSSGEVTALGAGTATITGKIRGGSISAQATLTVVPPGLAIEACFQTWAFATPPPGGVCPTGASAFPLGAGAHGDLWVAVRRAGGGAVLSGATVPVRDPFTGADVPRLAEIRQWHVYRIQVPAGTSPGQRSVPVGPATLAGYTPSNSLAVPLRVVLGSLGTGACVSTNASPAFDSNIHCPTGLVTATKGQTVYVWFGADYPSGTALCGATVTVKDPFTGVSTEHVVPGDAPNCLGRVSFQVPTSATPGDYSIVVGPSRLGDYADGPAVTLTLRVQ